MRVATFFRKKRSWLTQITVPSNACSACSRASFDGMSRWFVGSSRISSVAGVHMNFASATRAFSPPDRNFTFLCMASPLN
mmetsp:Transcript_3659/g.8134  ORF Transcript_3659/g.8134 Transcript_3659/m.8134 type:complete len:80 (+) Transcript_3659:127-366(+)